MSLTELSMHSSTGLSWLLCQPNLHADQPTASVIHLGPSLSCLVSQGCPWLHLQTLSGVSVRRWEFIPCLSLFINVQNRRECLCLQIASLVPHLSYREPRIHEPSLAWEEFSPFFAGYTRFFLSLWTTGIHDSLPLCLIM